MNITIEIPSNDTASNSHEQWEKVLIDAVGLALSDIAVTLNIKINNPNTPEKPICFDPLPDPEPNDIDPWGDDEYVDPWEPWPQFYAADRGDDMAI